MHRSDIELVFVGNLSNGSGRDIRDIHHPPSLPNRACIPWRPTVRKRGLVVHEYFIFNLQSLIVHITYLNGGHHSQRRPARTDTRVHYRVVPSPDAPKQWEKTPEDETQKIEKSQDDDLPVARSPRHTPPSFVRLLAVRETRSGQPILYAAVYSRDWNEEGRVAASPGECTLQIQHCLSRPSPVCSAPGNQKSSGPFLSGGLVTSTYCQTDVAVVEHRTGKR